MKKLLIIGGCCFLPTALYAQTPVQPQPAEYTIKLTTAEIDIVGKALGTQPYQDVALIIQKLRQQIVEQQSAKPVDKKE